MTEEAISAGSVTSKEALRNWKVVTDKALRSPVIITSHGRPRHVLLSYEDYERLRTHERQVYRTAELPADLADQILDSFAKMRDWAPAQDSGDLVLKRE